MTAGSPFSKYRLEDQTTRLRSFDMLQELACPLVVDDQNIVAAKEVIPPMAELILRNGDVEVRGRKPHVLQYGIGKWRLLSEAAGESLRRAQALRDPVHRRRSGRAWPKPARSRFTIGNDQIPRVLQQCVRKMARPGLPLDCFAATPHDRPGVPTDSPPSCGRRTVTDPDRPCRAPAPAVPRRWLPTSRDSVHWVHVESGIARE